MPKPRSLLDREPPLLEDQSGGLSTIWNALKAVYEDPSRILTTPSAQAIKSGVTLPRDVYEGRVDPLSDEGIARSQNMAGVASLGSMPMSAPRGAITAGMSRTKAPKVAPLVGPEARYQYANPKWATGYPDVPEPLVKLKNPKGPADGPTFLGRGNSDETKTFLKAREKIRKDMETNGYQQYFDPAKRADVDPSNYPTETNTLTQAVGAKPATRATHEAIAKSPEATARLTDAYQHGKNLEGSENWYFMKQLEDKYISELGPEAGRKAFRDKFAGQMAATTGGADPETNFVTAMHANYQQNKGLTPLPENAYAVPTPVSGRYLGNNLKTANKYYGQGMEPFDLQNPKRHDFQYNFLGHGNKATIDEQMSGLIKPGMEMPPTGSYGSYEASVHDLAKKFGVDPRYFQEVSWAGGKAMKDPSYTPHPMIETVNRSIERTSRLTGLSPEEVVQKGLIRNEMPMYEKGVPLPAAPVPAQPAPTQQPPGLLDNKRKQFWSA